MSPKVTRLDQNHHTRNVWRNQTSDAVADPGFSVWVRQPHGGGPTPDAAIFF